MHVRFTLWALKLGTVPGGWVCVLTLLTVSCVCASWLLQWTTVLDILEWFLHERGLTYVRLDGSTAVADRLTIVDTFNDPNGGVFAFLLSTRAGGQGLNLTGADTVILHDVDFNPQVGGWGRAT